MSDMSNTSKSKPVYILGGGAIGLTLAAYLASAGRNVLVVRTSRDDVSPTRITVTIVRDGVPLRGPLETVSLSRLETLDGVIAVTAKSYANPAIAAALAARKASGPVVLLQNGLGVERPFLDAPLPRIYRCVLYTTSQTIAENEVTFRPISSSPIGVVKGDEAELERCVAALATPGFPFHAEKNIERDVWKKAIANAVFNSICPLLDIDNGVFHRDPEAAGLAREVVRECLLLTEAKGLALGLSEAELMEQILRISKGSEGQLISTLQDIRHGRRTEIDSLNLEMARMAAALVPPVSVSKTEFLGKMLLAKSRNSGRPFGAG